MEHEKRMAGSYEIIQAFHIGDKEIVMGEDPSAKAGERYFCAYCLKNEIMALYNEILLSDDFCEIVKLFGARLSEQAEKTRVEVMKPKFQGINTTPLSYEDCTPISYNDDLNGKIVVIRPNVLRREYQMATWQMKLCVGGFGASPHSRGSACYCVDLYSGSESRFERGDILGTLEPDELPAWAKLGLVEYQQKHPNMTKPARKEEAR